MNAPYYQDERVTIHHGDALDVLRSLPDASVDAVVTDPPYGLEFMGKDWDRLWDSRGTQPGDRSNKGQTSSPHRGSNAPNYGRDSLAMQAWHREWAAECLRVLKPGGHLLSFGGSRTWHRLACAVEDAGFEVRDSIAWLYGSGFPKSLDVSKAIDKARDDREDYHRVADFLRAAADDLSSDELEAALGIRNVRLRYMTRSTPANPTRLPTWEQWLALKALLGFDDSMDAEVWRLNGRKGTPGEAWEAREIVGKAQWSNSANHFVPGEDHTERVHLDITAPATPDAERWQGWGTALKPAFEPVVVARKPLAGTVAANVLQHGTGALNIDATRIDGRERTDYGLSKSTRSHGDTYGAPTASADFDSSKGRWPTNVLLDESQAGELDEQSGETSSGGRTWKAGEEDTAAWRRMEGRPTDRARASDYERAGDTGGASRFFPTFRYEAKAPATERPRAPERIERATTCRICDAARADGLDPRTAFVDPDYDEHVERYHEMVTRPAVAHPTVKPLDLMRWLVRLVTPPGGTVLEPFAGSGTTVEACIVEGFHCIAIEREADYLPLIMQRVNRRRDPVAYIKAAGEDLGLFDMEGLA